MAKKPRRPLGRRLRRNPLARALAEGKYRGQVVARKGVYRRRAKHKEPPDDGGAGR